LTPGLQCHTDKPSHTVHIHTQMFMMKSVPILLSHLLL